MLPGAALYALNRISGTISIVNPVTDSLVKEIPIGSFDPTPITIRTGRGFLYDAKPSGNGTVACASCHIDAEMDLIAFLLSRYLGMRSFGEIYGYFFAIFMLGAGLGPYAMGISFDMTGSYRPMLVASVFALGLAIFLVLRLGAYVYPGQHKIGQETTSAAMV